MGINLVVMIFPYITPLRCSNLCFLYYCCLFKIEVFFWIISVLKVGIKAQCELLRFWIKSKRINFAVRKKERDTEREKGKKEGSCSRAYHRPSAPATSNFNFIHCYF
ncbi:hypothetical protein VNO77_41893 [Canavalia gladiata]|uniref:Uncharacterized protein n=1 Tax=Canavalia gladiata TaxID=3824 RepID=A0AAN9K1H6_CANGL